MVWRGLYSLLSRKVPFDPQPSIDKISANLFAGRYLKTAFPLAYIGISFLVLLSAYTYPFLRRHYHNYKLKSKSAQLFATTDDEYSDSEEVIEDTVSESDGDDSEATDSTLVDSLPQNTKITVIHDRPRVSHIRIVAEIALLLGQVALSIVTIIESEGWRSIAVVGHIQWIYLLIIAGLRLLGTKSTKSLWKHSTLIYMFSWPIAFILLRSAIIEDHQLHRNLQIANLALISGLCAITLTSRPGNKTARLVSTNGHEPTREPLASWISQATFTWVDPVIIKGWSHPFTAQDVWDLREDDQAPALLKAFRLVKQTTKSISIAWSLIRYFDELLIWQGFWALIFAVVTFLPTILLRQILLYVEDPQSTSRETAWLYVFGLLFASLCMCVGDGQSLWIGRRICWRLRAIVVGEVYSKALRRRDVALKGGDGLEDKEHHKTEKEKKKTAMQTNHGAIINLMAVDAFKVSEISAYLHYLFASVPVELAIAIALLCNLLGASALLGLLVMVSIFPVQYLITRRFNYVQDQLMSATDKRVNRLNEVLQAIRIIKFFAWEEKFNAIVNESRQQELKWLRERLVLWAAYGVCWYGFPIIVTLATFTCYTQWFGHDLTASTAFTALSLFSVLRKPIDQLADMITNVIQSKVSLDRVDQFLNEEETEKYATAVKRRKSLVYTQGRQAKFENATFTWASRTEIENEKATSDHAIAKLAFQLRDISINFPEDALTLIVGPTGCGKTSLLMALLGELSLLKGSVYLPCQAREETLQDPELGLTDTVAYCAQQAWLLNDTIKNNILFAAPYNKERYEKVIRVTALEKDLQILDGRDETEVGEKGITMSGGQKQRISLARALYSSARYILLDDCLSAVDSHTAQWIYQYALAGDLMAGRTRILVTHNVALTLPSAKLVVILDNGRIRAQGTPEEVIRLKGFGEETDSIRASLLRSGGNTPLSSQPPSRVHSTITLTAAGANQVDGNTATAKALMAQKEADRKKAGRLVQAEEKASGSVNWRVYKVYLESLGPWIYWVLVVCTILAQQASQVLQTYWIRAWAASYGTQKTNVAYARDFFATGSQSSIWGNSISYGFPQMGGATETVSVEGFNDFIMGRDPMFYIVGYCLVGLLYVAVTFIRSMLVVYGSIRAGRVLFEKLLASVTHAKLRFFDTTPIGRVMNRFSKDMETIDQETAWILFCVFFDLTSVITIVILITAVTPAFLFTGVVITALFIVIGIAYLRSSVELKRLESISRSPIFQHFGETLNGVSTIRAYGDEQRFIRENLQKINDNNRPFMLLWATNRWLSIRVDMAGALVAFFAGAFILWNVDSIDAGLAGLSLTYALAFTDHILWLVRLYSSNEMNMNSVERIRHYLQVESEAARRSPPGQEPPSDWPQCGHIKVEGLTLRYGPDLPTVIRDVTFEVQPAAKVAVVGRTGAGKSTIATAFFRFLEADKGKIEIDGVDIATIGLEELRSKLAIIPQDPTLFKGSLRFNLDPYGEHSDASIFEVLRRVHLVNATDLADHGRPVQQRDPEINQNVFLNLDTEIAEGGGNLSQGQRQLMCLARALLREPRVILMDEATASIDYTTDTKIQMTIRKEFNHSTILTIAHRLRSIIDFDKVLVLDAGEVKEYDHPYILLRTRDSIFRSMVEQSGEEQILTELAKAAWKTSKSRLVDDDD